MGGNSARMVPRSGDRRMAKLYASSHSDKGGREASKGGDKEIVTRLYIGNTPVYQVTFKGDTLQVVDAQTFEVLLEKKKANSTAQRCICERNEWRQDCPATFDHRARK